MRATYARRLHRPPATVRTLQHFSTVKRELGLEKGATNKTGLGATQTFPSGVLAAMPCLRHLILENHRMAAIGAIPEGAAFPELGSAEFAS